MPKKIKTLDKKARTIRSNADKLPVISPEQIERGLGAERADSPVELKGGPYALTALRQMLAERLRSTGGRPSLEGAVRRQKIPMTDEDWKHLEKLAELQKDNNIRPTPGQIAGALLHQALEEFEKEHAKEE